MLRRLEKKQRHGRDDVRLSTPRSNVNGLGFKESGFGFLIHEQSTK